MTRRTTTPATAQNRAQRPQNGADAAQGEGGYHPAACDLALSEADFQAQIVAMARLLGWRVQFHWSERHSPAGWPDLAMVRFGRLIFAELKSERGRLSKDQIAWLADLREVKTAETYVWRPSDWPEVERVLREGK